MKLLEIAPNFIMGQNGTLMTILQHLQSKLGKGAQVPISAVSNLMRNVGYGLTYDDFKKMYDSNPELQNLVGNFNQDTITIGKSDDEMPGDQEGGEDTVDQMAQTAAQNNIQQPVAQPTS
jgi:hypothetical protein